jgi:hypothetical protein
MRTRMRAATKCPWRTSARTWSTMAVVAYTWVTGPYASACTTCIAAAAGDVLATDACTTMVLVATGGP